VVFIDAKAGGLRQWLGAASPSSLGDLELLEVILMWFLVNFLMQISWEKLWISGPLLSLLSQIHI